MNFYSLFSHIALCLGIASLSMLSSAETAVPDEAISVNTSISSAKKDWQPYTQNAPAKDEYCVCQGRYVEPENNLPDKHLPHKEASLRLEADSSEYILGNNLLFKGRVEGSQGSLQLRADELKYNKDTQDIFLSGNVHIREPGTLITSQQALINRKTRSATIDNSHYLIHKSGAHGKATKVERNTLGNINMSDASYTLCEPHDHSWHIEANSIVLDTQENEGRAKHAKLYIKNVPVFYFPFFEFPLNNNRKTGILIPSIAQNNQGLDISVPYYVNLAPNYDLTVTPRYLAKHGHMLELETRYLHPATSLTLGGAYLASDKAYTSGSGSPKQRWLIFGSEQGQLDKEKRWHHEFKFQRVSDKDFFRELGAVGLDISRSTQLKSHAKVSYQADKWSISSYLESYQSLNKNLDDTFQRVPQLAFNYHTPVFNNLLAANIDSELTHFKNRDDSSVSGQRFYLEPSLSYTKREQDYLFSATAGLKHRRYNLSTKDKSKFSNNSINVPNLSLDIKTWLDKHNKDGSYQTIEPRIKYYFAKSASQENAPVFDTADRTNSYYQLFKEERFTGYDRISDANQLTLGVSSQYFNSDHKRTLDLGLAQQLYFKSLNVSSKDFSILTASEQAQELSALKRKKSDIGAYANINANQQWQINSEYLLNSNTFDFESASINLNYAETPEHYKLFNVGYQYNQINGSNNDLHQVSASAVYPINERLSAIAAFNYDLSSHSAIEDLLGFEYNNCCWKARLIYHREANTAAINTNASYEHAVRFEVQLKGLSSLSSSIGDLLNETIQGFDIREKNYQ